MQIKFVRTAILCLLSLASISLAEYTITSADGNGADTGLQNDNQRTTSYANSTHGSEGSSEIRYWENVRARCIMLRFDISDGIGGDVSGAILSLTETVGNRGRDLTVYGLNDGEGDNWDESTISYDTTPGLLPPYVYTSTDPNALITVDETVWTVVETFPFLDIYEDWDGSGSSYDQPTVISSSGSEDLDNFIAADTNGLLSFLIVLPADSAPDYYVAMKENTDGYAIPSLVFPNARFATNSSPENHETVLISHDTLSWTNTAPEGAGPITCDVYLGMNEPNFANPDYDLTKIAEGKTETSLTIPFALSEGKYYWVVDSYDAGTFLGNGAVWTFDVTAAPQVTTSPSDQIIKPGETAEFSVAVESVSAVTYTWYQSADNANDTPADDIVVRIGSEMLSIANVTVSDEGYYYCKAVNSSGEAMAAYSDVARLVVQRQVAHWTMNELVDGVLVDTSGEGNDATPSSEAIAFADGVNVLMTGQGSVFADSIYAQAGTYDPTSISGEFTISLWLRLDSIDGSTGIICKHNGWDANTTLWQFGTSSGRGLRIFRAGNSNVIYGQTLTLGQWYYVAVTFDGATANIYSFEVGSDDISFDLGSGAFSLGGMNDADFNIGCANIDSETGEPAELFNGMLDEIQVFNYAKSAIEIADLYNEAVAQDFCLLEYGSSEFDLDVNDNCRIDLVDFADLMQTWLECGLYPNCPQ